MDHSQNRFATEKRVKDAKDLRSALEAFADGVIENLRTADSLEDLKLMVDTFEADKPRAIDLLVEKAKKAKRG